MKHTAGKWYTEELKVISEGGQLIANINDEPDEADYQPSGKESDANCYLIAAAPELLEACKDLVKAHDCKMGKTAIDLRIDLARAAIQKAEGE